MPTSHGITVSLHSQYDARPIPEYAASAPSAQRQRCPSNATSTIDVDIAILPSSQFWLAYHCVPPPLTPPPQAASKPSVDEIPRYYLFKLSLANRTVLSWGVGAAEYWQGKTVCGFFDAGTDFEGRKVVEKRGLFFPSVVRPERGAGGFEVAVFRAKARKRMEGEVRFEGIGAVGAEAARNGIRFRTTGKLKEGERQMMYTYALIDPKDRPFVTFKYSLRTEAQLSELVPIDPANEGNSDDFQLAYADPAEANDTPSQDPHTFLRNPNTQSSLPDIATRTIRRLSFPPRRRLMPPTSGQEPWSPIKKMHASDESLKKSYSMASMASLAMETGDHPQCEWLATTSAPKEVKQPASLAATEPSTHKKTSSVSGGLLRSVVANALRRKEGKGW